MGWQGSGKWELGGGRDREEHRSSILSFAFGE